MLVKISSLTEVRGLISLNLPFSHNCKNTIIHALHEIDSFNSDYVGFLLEIRPRRTTPLLVICTLKKQSLMVSITVNSSPADRTGIKLNVKKTSKYHPHATTLIQRRRVLNTHRSHSYDSTAARLGRHVRTIRLLPYRILVLFLHRCQS